MRHFRLLTGKLRSCGEYTAILFKKEMEIPPLSKKELPFVAFTGKKRAPISLARNRCSHLFYRELL
jgi:hypothetical protein